MSDHPRASGPIILIAHGRLLVSSYRANYAHPPPILISMIICKFSVGTHGGILEINNNISNQFRRRRNWHARIGSLAHPFTAQPQVPVELEQQQTSTDVAL
jgi:hypothetical protein